MQFLEPMIILPYYVKDSVIDFIRQNENNYYLSEDFREDIYKRLSSRDRSTVTTLYNEMMHLLGFNNYIPNKYINYVNYYRGYTDFTIPHESHKSDVSLVLETLRDYNPGSSNEVSYDKLFDIVPVRYQAMTSEHINAVFTFVPNRSHFSVTRAGLVIFVNAGIGDILLDSDTVEKVTFIKNLSEYLYRYIRDNLGENTAKKSFLSLSRLIQYN